VVESGLPMTSRASRILVIALSFGACATGPSLRARQVVEADRNDVSSCQYLKEVQGTSGWGGLAASTGIENTKNEALDNAARAGATHIVWNSLVGGYSPSVSGKAYSCMKRRQQMRSDNQEVAPPAAELQLSAGPNTLPPPQPEPTRRSRSGRSRTCATYLNSGSGHWMTEKTDDGSVVILEDGSVWQIDPMDRLDTALWLPPSDIAVIETEDSPMSYLLVNTDDGEKATACLLVSR